MDILKRFEQKGYKLVAMKVRWHAGAYVGMNSHDVCKLLQMSVSRMPMLQVSLSGCLIIKCNYRHP